MNEGSISKQQRDDATVMTSYRSLSDCCKQITLPRYVSGDPSDHHHKIIILHHHQHPASLRHHHHHYNFVTNEICSSMYVIYSKQYTIYMYTCTIMYNHVPSCAILYHHVQSYRIMYHHNVHYYNSCYLSSIALPCPISRSLWTLSISLCVET